MTSLKATDKAKAKINNRFAAIAIFTIILIAEITRKRNWYKLLINPGHYTVPAGFFILFLVYILFTVLFLLPKKLNRIVQSIEPAGDTFKVTTFAFNVSYYPYKLKAITFDVKRDDVVYHKLQLDIRSIINNLPFSKSYSFKYNGNEYYIVPSLFNENVMETLSTNI